MKSFSAEWLQWLATDCQYRLSRNIHPVYRLGWWIVGGNCLTFFYHLHCTDAPVIYGTILLDLWFSIHIRIEMKFIAAVFCIDRWLSFCNTYISLLTAVWTILLVLTLKERGALFYIGEGVITFSLVFLVYFYRKVVKPLDIIGNGMELLREQDFSSRLTPVGQKEADRIVLVFNRMMEQLKDERLRLREQNHFLDLLVSASPMGVVILTLDGHISMLNAAALRFLDYSSSEEVRGRLYAFHEK